MVDCLTVLAGGRFPSFSQLDRGHSGWLLHLSPQCAFLCPLFVNCHLDRALRGGSEVNCRLRVPIFVCLCRLGGHFRAGTLSFCLRVENVPLLGPVRSVLGSVATSEGQIEVAFINNRLHNAVSLDQESIV
jgi:hypothetical protein